MVGGCPYLHVQLEFGIGSLLFYFPGFFLSGNQQKPAETKKPRNPCPVSRKPLQVEVANKKPTKSTETMETDL